MSAAAAPKQSGKRCGHTGLSDRLRAAVLTLAAREQGATVADVRALAPDITSKQASSVLANLRKYGLLHAATITHKGKRFFSTAAAAQRCESAHSGRQEISRTRYNPHAGRAPWPADAPMVVTPQTRHTIAPTPPRALKTNTHSQF